MAAADWRAAILAFFSYFLVKKINTPKEQFVYQREKRGKLGEREVGEINRSVEGFYIEVDEHRHIFRLEYLLCCLFLGPLLSRHQQQQTRSRKDDETNSFHI